MKISELAAATNSRVEGGPTDIEIAGAAGLDEAQPGQVTFLANPRYTPRLKTTTASAVFVSEAVDVGRNDIIILRSKDPYLAYTRALRLFHPETTFTPSIHPSAVIDPTERVSENAWIGPCTYVGPGSEIADGVQLFANVSIYDDVFIGRDTIIHSGA